MIYVASPYSNSNQPLVERRVKSVTKYTAHLLRKKIWAFSPIVYCHHMSKARKLPTDAKYWEEFNLYMMALSSELHVLMLRYWRRSEGVQFEIEHWKATRPNVPILYIDPDGYKSRYTPTIFD